MTQTLILIAGSTGGAIITFLLQKQGFSVVVASSLVGLLGALIGHYTSIQHLPLVIFAGSFVGMTSVSVGSLPIVAIAGMLAGYIYTISLNVFSGFGGRLGTIAFVSTIVSLYTFKIIKKGADLLINNQQLSFKALFKR